MQIINRLLKPEQKMKRFAIFATALVAVLTAGTAAAQEKGVVFSGGADVASNYVWRGVTQAGVSLQPTLTMTLGNFSATAWGSVDFAATSYKEMDITLAYALGPVTLSVADLYWEGSSADRGLVNRHYFHFGSDSPHRVEVGANWCVSRKVPLTLSWYTIVFGAVDVNSKGERAYSSYFEVAYPFTVKGDRHESRCRRSAMERIRHIRDRQGFLRAERFPERRENVGNKRCGIHANRIFHQPDMESGHGRC